MDEIHFNIPGAGPHIIDLSVSLASITDTVTIDATTEPDFAGTPVIVLDGGGGAVDGLVLTNTADGITLRGLLIRDFDFNGIVIQSGSDGNTIAGNWIGGLDTAGENG